MKASHSARFLKFFLLEKKKIQAGYSLRAMSRDLGLSQSYLSEIFSGKKIPSRDKMQRITRALGMDAMALRDYEESFLKDIFPESAPRISAEKTWTPVGIDDGQILRKWHYVVLLDLVDCKNFQADSAWIAKRIGIKNTEALEALQWLTAHKYIREKNGSYVRSKKKMRFHPAKSLPEIRAYHRQMIELAAQELNTKTDRKSYERRLITGITFSCDPRKIEAAKKHLLKAMYTAADQLMESDCTEVYQINLQIFPHTQ